MRKTLLSVLSVGILFFPTVLPLQQDAAGAYAPSLSPCPPGISLVRSAGRTEQRLSAAERRYVRRRRSTVLPTAWSSYLHNVEVSVRSHDVHLPSYVASILQSHDSSHHPNLGIAISGGAYRASFFGAGVLQALDGRNASAVSIGTGGVLQAATYLSGLSGSAWLVTSLAQTNFPTFPDLIFGSANPDEYAGWLAQIDFTQDIEAVTPFLSDLAEEVSVKLQRGFPVTGADVWARIVSRHFVNGTMAPNFFYGNLTHGAGELFSSLAAVPTFVNHFQPFPIVLSASTSVHENKSLIDKQSGGIVPLSNPLYEWNPFEMGSFDPMVSAFTPMKFIGSTNQTACVTGFDQAGFVTGISSYLFRAFNTSEATLDASIVGPMIEIVNKTFPQKGIQLDTAVVPNPFRGHANGTFLDSNEEFLRLVDGGFDGEAIPLQPLLVKARNIDTILVIDTLSDAAPIVSAGVSMIASQNRAGLFPTTYAFPPVPTTPDVFFSQNLTTRPTFFGCDTSSDAPLMIYIANGGPPLGQPPVTNISSLTTVFPNDKARAFLDQSFDIAIQGISVDDQRDPEWPACLACALVDRKRSRRGVLRRGVCKKCLERYCWS